MCRGEVSRYPTAKGYPLGLALFLKCPAAEIVRLRDITVNGYAIVRLGWVGVNGVVPDPQSARP